MNKAETIKMKTYARVLRVFIKGSTEKFATGKEVYTIQIKGSNGSQSIFARIVTVDHKNLL